MRTSVWCSAALCLCLTFSGFAADAPAPSKATLVHVVCFKFKADATPEQIKKLEDAFRSLKAKIPQVLTYQGGANVSKQNRDEGFKHCSILTFKSQEDLDTYQNHPDHLGFKNSLGDIVDKVIVMDFWEPTP